MAMFICGRTMGHYTWHNLSMHAKIILPTLLHSLAILAETYVFSFLGLAFWTFEHNWRPGFTFTVLLILLLARFISVFPMVGLFNACNKRKERVSFKQQFFMWFTGLRGAIAFGLALSADTDPTFSQGRLFVSTTLVIVVITVFVFGGAADGLLTCMGLAKKEEKARKGGWVYRLFSLEKRHVAPILRPPKESQQEAYERRYGEAERIVDSVHVKFALQRRAG
eukprot:gene21179-62195_t